MDGFVWTALALAAGCGSTDPAPAPLTEAKPAEAPPLAPSPAPPPPAPTSPPGPLTLAYTPPAESMDSGWCKGIVPANVAARLSELGVSPADLADRAPCGSADYDGDGALDFAFPSRKAGRCEQHVTVDLVFAMGPDGARIQRVTDTEAGGCFHPGALGDQPAILYFGEGGGDWAVVWQADKMGVTLAAMGD